MATSDNKHIQLEAQEVDGGDVVENTREATDELASGAIKGDIAQVVDDELDDDEIDDDDQALPALVKMAQRLTEDLKCLKPHWDGKELHYERSIAEVSDDVRNCDQNTSPLRAKVDQLTQVMEILQVCYEDNPCEENISEVADDKMDDDNVTDGKVTIKKTSF